MNAPFPAFSTTSSCGHVDNAGICRNHLPAGPLLLRVRERSFDEKILECHAPGADPSEWFELLAAGDTVVKRTEEVGLLSKAEPTLEAAAALAALEAGL